MNVDNENEMIRREVKDMEGIKVDGDNINSIGYADDTALLRE